MKERMILFFKTALVLAAAMAAALLPGCGGGGEGEPSEPSYSQPELAPGDSRSEEEAAGEDPPWGGARAAGRLEDITLSGGGKLVKAVKKTAPLICEFKADHIRPYLSASGRSLLLRSAAAYAPVPDILQNNSPGLFGQRTKFKYIFKDRLFKKGAFLIRPYNYNPANKYKLWCPEKGVCRVYIAFQGAVHEPRSPKKGAYASYLFSGSLLVSIIFNGEILDFSSGPDTTPEESKK